MCGEPRCFTRHEQEWLHALDADLVAKIEGLQPYREQTAGRVLAGLHSLRIHDTHRAPILQHRSIRSVHHSSTGPGDMRMVIAWRESLKAGDKVLRIVSSPDARPEGDPEPQTTICFGQPPLEGVPVYLFLAQAHDTVANDVFPIFKPFL